MREYTICGVCNIQVDESDLILVSIESVDNLTPPDYSYMCPECEQLTELKSIKKEQEWEIK